MILEKATNLDLEKLERLEGKGLALDLKDFERF
jgi:hypothetical protein